MINNQPSQLILEAKDITKTFSEGGLTTPVIKGINFTLAQRETVAIVGSSGSGKTTLLQMLGGLEQPTSGTVSLMGQDFFKLSESKRGKLRNQHMGFVYQFHFLLPELTALENTMLPLRVRRSTASVAEAEAKNILDKVGLSARIHHKPSELSGGERQRVAIARALITKPNCVLADEPTGNLDDTSAQQVFDLMLTLNQEMNTGLLVVTHDMKLAAQMDKQCHLVEGLFSAEKSSEG
ncbi:MAG TPA: lipoprotein-releasing system ATP-binding protein LolD [Thiomicrospira sp.]|jgi:lipoprotein-releasing system ATP-binding protein|nr:lipoprotein-releasing system ATP-binding protein LolD [Thiomicrospira sp.]